jgi:hypothetical protein
LRTAAMPVTPLGFLCSNRRRTIVYFLWIYIFYFLSLRFVYGSSIDELLVIGVDVDPTIPLAYPLEILNYHQVVNIIINGIPFAVTYDQLSGSNIMFNTSSLLG